MNNTYYSYGRQISVLENNFTPCASASMSDVESDVFYKFKWLLENFTLIKYNWHAREATVQIEKEIDVQLFTRYTIIWIWKYLHS